MPGIGTETLAFFAGLYMLAAGIGLFVDPERFGSIMEEFLASAALTYIAAMAALIFGAVIVSFHNVWTGPAAILVTLIGWGALVEGALLLAAPAWFLGLFAPLAANARLMRGFGALTVALGVFLIAASFA